MEYKLFYPTPDEFGRTMVIETLGEATKRPYRKVDAGFVQQINIARALDAIFERYNIDYPVAFRGRSMCGGDVVVLNPPIGDPEWWLCQSVGWRKLTPAEMFTIL